MKNIIAFLIVSCIIFTLCFPIFFSKKQINSTQNNSEKPLSDSKASPDIANYVTSAVIFSHLGKETYLSFNGKKIQNIDVDKELFHITMMEGFFRDTAEQLLELLSYKADSAIYDKLNASAELFGNVMLNHLQITELTTMANNITIEKLQKLEKFEELAKLQELQELQELSSPKQQELNLAKLSSDYFQIDFLKKSIFSNKATNFVYQNLFIQSSEFLAENNGNDIHFKGNVKVVINP